MSKRLKTYLGDGVYASTDGFHIILSGDAHGQDNYVYLDSSALSALMEFIEHNHGVKITVEKRKEEV